MKSYDELWQIVFNFVPFGQFFEIVVGILAHVGDLLRIEAAEITSVDSRWGYIAVAVAVNMQLFNTMIKMVGSYSIST